MQGPYPARADGHGRHQIQTIQKTTSRKDSFQMTNTRFLAYLLSAVALLGLVDIGYQHTQACENRAHYFYSICKN